MSTMYTAKIYLIKPLPKIINTAITVVFDDVEYIGKIIETGIELDTFPTWLANPILVSGRDSGGNYLIIESYDQEGHTIQVYETLVYQTYNEVVNARVGFDDTQYETLGQAIRTQISNLNTTIDNLQEVVDSKADYIPTVQNIENDVTSLQSNVNSLSSDVDDLTSDLNNKVDKVEGKELSTNDFTDAEKNKLAGIEAGAQVNIIEHVKVNGSDLTVTNKRVDLGSIPTAAELEALETRVETAEGDIDDLEENKEDKTNLKALAYKDSATAHVVSKTVSGVKASGTTTGELTGSLAYTSTAVTSSGTYTPEGDVELTGSAIASAALSSTPLTIKSMKTAGSVASFTEGAYTAATLDHTEASFAKEGLKAHVGVTANEEDAECLYFETATTANASLINGFTGGSKAADTFTANVLPTFEDKVAIANGAEVTTTAATLSAEFTGDAKAVSVSGNYDKANLGTVAFSGKAVELNVGDIVVPAQEATVD